MKLKADEFTKLLNVLFAIDVKGNAKFNFCLIRNKNKLLPIAKDIYKAAQEIYPPEVYRSIMEFDKTRRQLLKKYAKTDEAGELITGKGGLAIFKDKESEKKFDEEIRPHLEHYEKMLKEYEKYKPKEQEFLNSEIEFDPIPFEGEVPDELATKQLEALIKLGIIEM